MMFYLLKIIKLLLIALYFSLTNFYAVYANDESIDPDFDWRQTTIDMLPDFHLVESQNQVNEWLPETFYKIQNAINQFNFSEAISHVDIALSKIHSLDRSRWSFQHFMAAYFLYMQKADILYIAFAKYESSVENYFNAYSIIMAIDVSSPHAASFQAVYTMSPLSKIANSLLIMTDKNEQIKDMLNELEQNFKVLGGGIDSAVKFTERHGDEQDIRVINMGIIDYLYLKYSLIGSSSVSHDLLTIQNIVEDYNYIERLIKSKKKTEFLHLSINMPLMILPNIMMVLYKEGFYDKAINMEEYIFSYDNQSFAMEYQDNINTALNMTARLLIFLEEEKDFPDPLKILDIAEKIDNRTYTDKYISEYPERFIIVDGINLDARARVDIAFGYTNKAIAYLKKYLIDFDKYDVNKHSYEEIRCLIFGQLGKAYMYNKEYKNAASSFEKTIHHCSKINEVKIILVLMDILEIYILRDLNINRGLELIDSFKEYEHHIFNFFKSIAYIKLEKYNYAILEAESGLKQCPDLFDPGSMERTTCKLFHSATIAMSLSKKGICNENHQLMEKNLKNFYEVFKETIVPKFEFASENKVEDFSMDFVLYPLLICNKFMDSSSNNIIKMQQLLMLNNSGNSYLNSSLIKQFNNPDLKSLLKEYEKLKWILRKNISSRDEEFYNKANRVFEIEDILYKNYPSYWKQAVPKLVNIQDIGKKLKKDEAFIVFNTTLNASYVTIIYRKQGTEKTVSKNLMIDITSSKIIEKQKLLRKGLELSAQTRFDIKIAHELYQILFSDIEPYLKNINHLIIVADSTISSIPMNVLIASKQEIDINEFSIGENTRGLQELDEKDVNNFDGSVFRHIDWLGLKYSITAMPSIESFIVMRDRSSKEVNQFDKTFVGIGNPILEGGTNCIVSSRNISSFYNEGLGDIERIASLCPLPETADELKSISLTLNGDKKDLYIGKRANEKNVKAANLSDAGIIAFATHGLLTGEVHGLTEPALVLTPPQTASITDDGLLTASEISQLNLSAELVILSACNTAGGFKAESSNVFGLANSFFFAGAESLLLSQWPVISVAAEQLTTKMIKEYNSDSSLSKAEALRRSMLYMISDLDDDFAHPAFWAPFMIVGVGR